MSFIRKHIGINPKYVNMMLKRIGYNNEVDFIKDIIPSNINYKLKHFDPISEKDSLDNLDKLIKSKELFDKTNIKKSLIGLDYNESILPNVIKRNVLENPQWYTSYTPYQAEISQGRLESLFNFQTLISEITKLPVSNCSLLDSGSAATEAMSMTYAFNKNKKKTFVIDSNMFPHITENIITRCEALGLNYEITDFSNINITDDIFGAIFSYPDFDGNIDFNIQMINELKKAKIPIISHNDILSLLLLKPPGEIGVDISVGTTQRFGLPLWFGGPHSAFIACKNEMLRFLPGRIVGESVDRNNNKCYRLALQTREQHIRKDKALSNICTSQALLANTSSMYAIYHGRDNLINISNDVLAKSLALRYLIKNDMYIKVFDTELFDTVKFKTKDINELYKTLLFHGYSVRKNENDISITLNEAFTNEDCICLLEKMGVSNNVTLEEFEKLKSNLLKSEKLKTNKYRNDDFLTQEIFREEKDETQMLRYINYLVSKDYSLTNGMIPLGSCTMKLNSTTQMTPLSFKELQEHHPYSEGIPVIYREIFKELSKYLLDVTGMKAISFQPNSGAMGEYAGLLCIKKYHENQNNEHRNICLIPNSAHGTNFASAKICNMTIKKFSDDLTTEQFEELVLKYKDQLSCLIITYPNTYGIFAENIKDMIDIVHNNGGLVYMDGANMNAQSGLTSPGTCGADVCHLNLHKTFCIPHGGGGPGMGPICVNEKLADILPSNIYTDTNYLENKNDKIGMITNSQYASASILVIPYLYFKNMGSEGIKKATIFALLNANYMKFRLQDKFKIYSENKKGLVGHEFIIDLNEFKKYGINEKHVAKRLIDYSFHPPTMSWPVNGAIMIEPTESENLEELERFILAMETIYEEIMEIKNGKYSKTCNVLVNAPHNQSDVIDWKFDYTMEKAFYPVENLKKNKLWPGNVLIDDIYGDRNLKLTLDK